MTSSPVILLTATVQPLKGQPGLVVSDPCLRLSQYLAVFSSVLHLDAKIVLVENSGADLRPFLDLARSMGREADFEALSVGVDWKAEMGRGYAETLLVGEGIARSRIIEANSLIWKVTGRYKVANLGRLMAAAPDCDLCVNLRRYPRAWADMWVYALTPHGWSLLAPHVSRLRSDSLCGPAELGMFEIVKRLYIDEPRILRRLPYEPRISGVRGYDGRSYEGGRQRTKYFVRASVRQLAPWIWL